MDQTLSELIEVSEAVYGDMPPDVREALDEIIAGITRDLGESPEAWRGAARVVLEIMRGIIESNSVMELDSTGRFMLLVLSRFVALPWANQALEAMRMAHEAAS